MSKNEMEAKVLEADSEAELLKKVTRFSKTVTVDNVSTYNRFGRWTALVRYKGAQKQ